MNTSHLALISFIDHYKWSIVLGILYPLYINYKWWYMINYIYIHCTSTSHSELISFIHHYEFEWSIVQGSYSEHHQASSDPLVPRARSMQSVQIAYHVTLMRPWRMQGFYLMHLQAVGAGSRERRQRALLFLEHFLRAFVQWDELTFCVG